MSDLIKREEVLKKLNYEMKYGTEIDRCGLDTAYDIIENIPSAEPEMITNEPLTLYDLIDMMKEKKPVWIAGYGWFFIESIVCDLNSTRVITHTNNNFVYTKDSTRFYRYEVK